MKFKRPDTPSFIHFVPALNVRDLTYTCMQTYRCAAIHTCMQPRTHVHNHTYMCTNHACIQLRMRAYNRACVHIAGLYACTQPHSSQTDSRVALFTAGILWNHSASSKVNAFGDDVTLLFFKSRTPSLMLPPLPQRPANIHLYSKIKLFASITFLATRFWGVANLSEILHQL